MDSETRRDSRDFRDDLHGPWSTLLLGVEEMLPARERGQLGRLGLSVDQALAACCILMCMCASLEVINTKDIYYFLSHPTLFS